MNISATKHIENLKQAGLQQHIDDHIRFIGGYWPPLSAVARLLEELGELSDVLLLKDSGPNVIAEEISDVFLISTCLANQYCADLAHEYAILSEHPDTLAVFQDGDNDSGIFMRLTSCAGDIGRIINSYEGDKPPKASEKLPKLSEKVAALHILLLSMAVKRSVDLTSSISSIVRKSRTRDRNRFKISHDPTTEDSLIRFKDVVNSSYCPFATRSKLWGNYLWDEEKSIDMNIENSVVSLRRFSRCCDNEGLDGFIIEVRNKDCNDFDKAKLIFKQTLTSLCKSDPSGYNCLDENLLNPLWRFSFNNIKFFISVFAPFYQTSHPRYSPYDGSLFIFLQTDSSFSRNGIGGGSSKTSDIKNSVRDIFKKNHAPYNIDIVGQPLEVLKFFKPRAQNDPPVIWW